MKLVIIAVAVAICWSQVEAGGECPPPETGIKPDNCDRCDKLFSSSSKFMQYCGRFLSVRVLNKLQKDCYKPAGDDDRWAAFIDNLQLYCDSNSHPWTGTIDCPQVCDLCVELFNPDSSFMQNCGQFVDDSDITAYMALCENAALDELDFQAFIDDLKYDCVYFFGYNNFDFPMCECNPCVKLQYLGGDFMTKCFPYLPDALYNLFINSCYDVKDDSERLWELWNKIEAVCYYLTYEKVVLPMCNCDVCHLLLQHDSDFMEKCGQHMSPSHLRCIMYECDLIKCDSAARWDFMEWLEGECAHYGLTEEYEFPQCFCEECWMMFDEDSDFMQGCGSYLTAAELKYYRDECFKVQHDMFALWDFFEKCEEDCYYYHYVYFEIPQCECEVCWLLKDPSNDFYHDCWYYLDYSTREHIIDYCLKVWDDPDQYENFLEYVEDICYYYTYYYVDVPTCNECTENMIDLVFVLDSSGSIWPPSLFDDMLDFVKDICAELNIGTDTTHVGIINFSTDVMIEIGLNAGDNKIDVSNELSFGISQKGQLTNTGQALMDMNDLFDDEGRAGSIKIGVIVTDGYPTIGPGIPVINAGVRMIAIGIGNGVNVANLNLIATDPDADNVILTPDFDGLKALAPVLVDELCP